MNGIHAVLEISLGLIGMVLAIYLPGSFCLRRLKLSLTFEEWFAGSLVVGSALLTISYGLLSAIGLGAWLWGYVAILAGWEIYIGMKTRHSHLLAGWRQSSEGWLWILVAAVVVIQGRFTFFTGWPTPSGVSLLAWHGHDAPWHLYNLYQLSFRFPPEMPGFSGVPLKNYHLFADLLWGALARLFMLDPWHLYFRIAPFFYSITTTITLWVAAESWSGKKPVAYLAVVLGLLASNFGYLLPLLGNTQSNIFWDSIFWVQSPVTMIFNPGVSASFGYFLFGLWALTRWLRPLSGRGYLLILVICWGVLPGFKAYPGVLVVGGLLSAGLLQAFAQRRFKLLLALAALMPLFLIVFLPPNLHAPEMIKLLPGFNLATMLVDPARMALFSSAQLKFIMATKPGLMLLIMAGLALVFFVGNMGMRILGSGVLVKALWAPRRADPVTVFMACLIAGAWAAPVLLVQTGTQWNTIQFFYYAVLLGALPAAQQLWNWLEDRGHFIQWLSIGVVVGLGLPALVQALLVVATMQTHTGPATAAAMQWLRENTPREAVVLRPLPDSLMQPAGYQYFLEVQNRGKLTSLTAWQQKVKASVDAATSTAQAGQPSTAIGTAPVASIALERTDAAAVAALALRNTYMEDTHAAQIKDLPIVERVAAVRAFYTEPNAAAAKAFLEKAKIKYVLLMSGQIFPFEPITVGMEKVFENKSMAIFKVFYRQGAKDAK